MKRKAAKISTNQQKPLYPNMIPLKIVVRLNPLELGVYFKETPQSLKKKIYLVELKNLIMSDDPNKITKSIYQQHGQIFQIDKIPFSQIYNIINKMLEYIKSELMEDGEEYSIGELGSNM